MPVPAPKNLQQTNQGRARLFFALSPDEATREAIYKASRNAAQANGGRAIPPENFHITLAFLGSPPSELEEQVAAKAVATAEGVQVQPFRFELDELGYWPSAKVVWYGCSTPPETLRALALEIRRRLGASGLPHHDDKFVPHLTLARWVQKAGPFAPAQRIAWDVSEFVLIRSETLSAGVRYTQLARCALGRQGVLI